MPRNDDDMDISLTDDDLIDDDPIPARRDVRIFHRKKEEDVKKHAPKKEEEFDEDIFV